ncbi:MAG: peroxiredoxin family protein [Kangiellaceae bacterium]|nr:peroxiredoxin family protein [Kangiellaceae bacterium]
MLTFRKILAITMALSTVLASTLLKAESLESMQTGIEIGTSVPEISAIGIDKNSVNLNGLYGEKGLVLVFFRSADWCPFCKKHLIEINQWAEKIKQQGYHVAAISYDSPEVLKQFKDEAGISYTLLADVDSRTVNSYDVVNQKYKPGHRHYGIPYPGVMVIDTNGKLKDKYFYQGYKKRITAEHLLNKLN